MTSRCHSAPMISVVVPNYNHARFLRARLDTIFAQSFRDFEVILLDDASTDSSCEIIDAYSQRPGVRVQLNERNSGSTFRQWNRGAAMARGKFLWFAESDDEADPDMLGELVEYISGNPRMVLAYCRSSIIDDAGRAVGDCADWNARLDAERWQRAYTNSGADEVAIYLSRHNTIVNASSALIQREAYLKCGGAPEKFRLCGDWDTYARLLPLGEVGYWPVALNRFRTHGKSVRSLLGEGTRAQLGFQEGLEVVRSICRAQRVPRDVLEEIGQRQRIGFTKILSQPCALPSPAWAIRNAMRVAAFPMVGFWGLLWLYARVRLLRNSHFAKINSLKNLLCGGHGVG